MFYDDLLHADPSAFEEAASSFNGFGADVRDRAVDYNQQVLAHLNDDDTWSGKSASAARRPSGDLQLALNRAAEQLEAVPAVLRDHAEQLAQLKARLKGVVANASDAGIEVRAAAEKVMVTAPADLKQRSQDAGWPDPEHAVLEDIQAVLEEATELDQNTAERIQEVLTAETLDAHEVGAEYRDAVKDAKRAEKLLDQMMHGTYGDMFDEGKRKELMKLLKEHADDPEFAATLLKGLGGKGTMEALKWVTDLAGPTAALLNIEIPRTELRSLQKQLGGVLALGTNPDAAFHVGMSKDSKWMREFMAAGRSQFGGDGGDPYGYQVLGATLHSGNYSSEFLNLVGDDIVDMERKDPDVFRNDNPSQLRKVDLNFVDNVGAGRDPINGLMMAMERNPEAATEFFDPAHDERNGYSRIDYLLDRDDWGDNPYGPSDKPSDSDASQALVIDAIAAATDGADRRSAGFDIAAETINHLGDSDADAVGLRNDPSREARGRLLQGQLDHVNDAMTSRHSDMQRDALSRVLGDVAHDPETYARLANAERAYTALQMEALMRSHGDDAALGQVRGDLVDVGQRMASVMAHLDEGRSVALEHEWKERENEYNEGVHSVGEVAGYALDKAVGALPGGDWVRDLAKDGVGALTGGVVDDIVGSATEDYGEEAAADVRRLYGDHRKESAFMVEQIMWEHQLHEADVSEEYRRELFRDGHPIPLGDMTSDQLLAYEEWADSNVFENNVVRHLNDVGGAYTEQRADAEKNQQMWYSRYSVTGK